MGLLDDELFRSLLGGSAGLLKPGAAPSPASGLLGTFKPGANEGLATRLFGDPRNPLDPRGDAMSALSVGLLRGDLAGGFEGANRAFSDAERRAVDAEDRNWKRAANALTIGKSAYELSSMQQAAQRQQAIQQERAKLRGVQQFQSLPIGTDGFGVPTAGDVPLFSLGSLPRLPQTTGAGQGVPSPAGGAGMGGGYGSGGNVGQSQQLYQQLLQEADLYNRHGDTKTALEYYQRAEQYKPKFSLTPQLMRDPRTNKLVQVTLNEDGGYQILPFGAKPDITVEDLGGRKVAVDRNATQDGRTWDKTMTPGETASNKVAWANYGNARDRLQWDKSQAGKPQLQDGAWFYPPNAQNPQGAVARPPMPEGMDPKLTEVQGNATQFASRMRDASRTLEQITAGGDSPWPSTVERAGYKPEFPNWLPGGQIASAGISAANKLATPEAALQMRQAQDNWITANLRKESGAAIPVPELEAERSKWFPMPGEGEATAKQKAAARRVAEEAMLVQAGPGAKMVPRVLARADEASGRQQQAQAAKPVPLPSTNLKDLKHGTLYTLPNGKAATWDSTSKTFKVQ